MALIYSTHFGLSSLWLRRKGKRQVPMKEWMLFTFCCVFVANYTAAQVPADKDPKALDAEHSVQNPGANVIENNPSGGSQTVNGTVNLANSVTISNPCAIGSVIY